MLQAIIVDDSPRSQKTLYSLLQKYCPQVNILGMADSARSALKLIEEKQPNLVFLDIEMPHGSGFDLLSQFDLPNFEVIFVTAFDQYALQAIKFCALDYILKPIDHDELILAVQKAANRVISQAFSKNYRTLLENLKDQNPQKHKLAVPTQDGFEFIPIDQIIWLEAEGTYTRIHLRDRNKMLSTRLLKEYEDLLTQQQFFRIHRSYLINLKCVHRYLRGTGGQIELNDGTYLSVARNRKEDFLAKMNIS